MKTIVSKRFLNTIFKYPDKFNSALSIKHAWNFSTVPTNQDIIEKAHVQYENYKQRRAYSFIHDTNYLCLGENLHTDEVLFEMFKNEETGLLSIGKFLNALRATGLRKTDPRLKEMMDVLKTISKKNSDGYSIDTQKLKLDTFKSIIAPNIGIISRAFRRQFIIPEFQEFCKDIEEIYWKCKENTNGKVAAYIPQLKRMSPNYWGVSICTIDGQRFSVGDVAIPFTIQSCSKPLTYGIALDLLGSDVVHKYVGQEPSGRNFNELILDHNKKPHNPMINAGAIIVCALLKTIVGPEMSLAEKFDFTMNYFEANAQNKNWALFTACVIFVNEDWGPESIPFRYFEPGNSFMKADSVHDLIGKKWKHTLEVLDYEDLVHLIESSNKLNQVINFRAENFLEFENGCQTRKKSELPKLNDIKCVQFLKGSRKLFFEHELEHESFSEVYFLKPKLKLELPKHRCINQKKKDIIIKELAQYMPPRKYFFCKNLPSRDVDNLGITAAKI